MSTVAAIRETSLPGLIDRAATALASARSSAEVLEARDLASFAYDAAKKAARLAKFKRAHDDVIAAVHRAQADALVIESEAKKRLADEYDAAQERGEVAKQGQRTDLLPAEKKVPTPADVGLTYKQVHEARQIRDAERADPGIVRRVVDQRLRRGEEPTKAAVRDAVTPFRRPEEPPRAARDDAHQPKPSEPAQIVSLETRTPRLPSFEGLDRDNDAEDAAEDLRDGPQVDLDTVEGRAHAINGALSTLDLIEITGREYWAVFHKDPARTVYEGWVRAAHAKLTSILQEIGDVQLQGAAGGQKGRGRKGSANSSP